MGGGDAGADLLQHGLELLAPARDDDDLDRVLQLGERFQDDLRRADAERPGGDEDDRQGGVEAELGAEGGGVLRGDGAEDRVDGDAADGDPVARQAELLQVHLRLLQRDEVAVERAGEPHGVKSRSVTTMERCAWSFPEEMRWEMIAAGRKWVQTVMSGSNFEMKLMRGRVLSRSSMRRIRSVFHGSSLALYHQPRNAGALSTSWV